MSKLGNFLWFIFGGWYASLTWALAGMLWCITIIGIPLGKQCFKFARLSLMPFDKEVVNTNSGATSFILNVIWVICTGAAMAINNLILGIIFAITIIGLPFAKQYFKLAILSFTPFGLEVRKK